MSRYEENGQVIWYTAENLERARRFNEALPELAAKIERAEQTFRYAIEEPTIKEWTSSAIGKDFVTKIENNNKNLQLLAKEIKNLHQNIEEFCNEAERNNERI